MKLTSPSQIQVQLLRQGGVATLDALAGANPLRLNLFTGNELEGGPLNLVLRRRAGSMVVAALPLLGAQQTLSTTDTQAEWQGEWQGLAWRLQLRLAASQAAWFWQLQVENLGPDAAEIDAVLAQDVALAGAGAVRTNEYYVSQYLDHSPLQHASRGWLIATRQNLAQKGKNPWLLSGSLRKAVAYGTDTLQVCRGAGFQADLPSQRLQGEHAMQLLQDEALSLAPGQTGRFGFFSLLQDDHPAASSDADLAIVDALLAAPEASFAPFDAAPSGTAAVPSLFTSAPVLSTTGFNAEAHFPAPWRHVERDGSGALLSFFHGESSHVVMATKQAAVLRPHGHLLRSGQRLVPDESAMTSTCWMDGVFHSMLTQGHVAANRMLSTQRSLLGLFRSQGLRIFVEIDGQWQLLDRPSAFEMQPHAVRWLYAHEGGVIEIEATASADPASQVNLRVRAQAPLLLTLDLALDGDDAACPGMPLMENVSNRALLLRSRRDARLGLRLTASESWLAMGDDSLVMADGASRGHPMLALRFGATPELQLQLQGALIEAQPAPQLPTEADLSATLPKLDANAPAAIRRLQDILPWYEHNALIHYLAPRGLEQFTGGGWGTRDVSQGPVELLLSLGRHEPVRELLQLLFANQNADGDWPQWFMFFDAQASIRADDSHGDIVFWPLLALGQYLLASGDGALLDVALPFHGAPALPLIEHVQRTLELIASRSVAGTQLVSYGHGDWNDALQPADPRMREHMCSSWTVTLHVQMLDTLARGLRAVGRAALAEPMEAQAAAVRADFERLLMPDGVLAGYALFTPGAATPEYLLHPRDGRSGVAYSLLPMMHGVLSHMLSPAQAESHFKLIEQHLLGPDGARLFDAPMVYRGGPQILFQRAESAANFGREIGLMYMHAHLRYAESLAVLGRAEAFFAALERAHPIALSDLIPGAAPRQANCYYSSSDAAFPDRYVAQEHYGDINSGRVAFEGGWRVYSSGAGIALSLIMRSLLGLRTESTELLIDPVIPQRFSGLTVQRHWLGHDFEIRYQLGPKGHGVQGLTLNGSALQFGRADHPYRVGAAVLDLAAFKSQLKLGVNVLEIRCA
ncbi:hypothetical protein ACFJGW_14125 [Burkholderiaceae bacterium UC74_6]